MKNKIKVVILISIVIVVGIILIKTFSKGSSKVINYANEEELKEGIIKCEQIEKELYKKYNERFVCTLTYSTEEWTRFEEYTAYPINNKKCVFNVYMNGSKIWKDYYYYELNKDKINDFVYQSIKKYGIDKKDFEIKIDDTLTTKKISQETFKNKKIMVDIHFDNLSAVHDFDNNAESIIKDMYKKMNSGSDISIDCYLQDEVCGWYHIYNRDTYLSVSCTGRNKSELRIVDRHLEIQL